jgi:hypothetical protein
MIFHFPSEVSPYTVTTVYGAVETGGLLVTPDVLVKSSQTKV